MADIAASVLAKLKNKAKASGISYQQCLQLKVADIAVHNARSVKYQKAWQSNSVQVSDHGTAEKREPHIEVFLQLLNNGQGYYK